MIIIDNKVVEPDILQKNFVCNLQKCKGACCVQGEGGALLEPHEAEIMEQIYPIIEPLLTLEGKEAIQNQGIFEIEHGKPVTPLINGGACVYVIYDSENITKCAFEVAYEQQLTQWKKPISCHLYPIRTRNNPQQSPLEYLHYEKWHICKAACKLGNQLQVPVYEFLKEPLIRKYGNQFYEQLHGAAQFLQKQSQQTTEEPIDDFSF